MTFADVAGVDEAKQDFQEVRWASGSRAVHHSGQPACGRAVCAACMWQLCSSCPRLREECSACWLNGCLAFHNVLAPRLLGAQIVEFLKKPERFTAVGARIPKGVLLVGPPGEHTYSCLGWAAGSGAMPEVSTSKRSPCSTSIGTSGLLCRLCCATD